MIVRATLFTLLMFISTLTFAQELRCKVSVNADRVLTTNKRIFKTLETSISEFMNNYRWTKDNFTLEERIDCMIVIIIEKFDAPDQITASIQISASRPVFNTNITTSLINQRDQDFNFTYQENAPIEFTPDQFRSNLSSVLAYYAYLIIGMDYDSFSKEGGTPYYLEAQRIVTNAQGSGGKGWSPTENTKNRFWIVDNILQQSFQPLRQCLYDYHRNGMDVMYDNTVEGRKKILESLEGLKKIHQIKPLSYNMKLFFDAKSDEIINIFSKADQAEKARVLSILRTVDPINSTKYDVIAKSN